MNDYEPLDLSGKWNAGAEVCAPRTPAVGAQQFHGLPFQIGADGGGNCFIAFGSEAPCRSDAVCIVVGNQFAFVGIAVFLGAQYW